ncbi:hypothetical protein PENARI_c004G06602 [Penicillium arizonense]|uniref:Uncharacterized protein n=1 Tax=Penicillium arizonense TaxID=1835702 RepID=A0A1F5LQ83_PENAI|nr:hypothetical protein PENARI_c004G06602 [Penicillium arizonense]OGE55358.1 hypothetical protein PENARI_c004G06602 [Penicillium arizonense]
MSAPGGAPSPAPRSGSMGPGANGTGMSMATQQPLSGTPVHQPSTPGPTGPSAPPSGAMSQQNLNQIALACRNATIPSSLCYSGVEQARW